jgi:hypothetical protein
MPMTLDSTLPPSLRPLANEICTYLRELPRLLAEGKEGRFVLINGDQVLSVWDTFGDALQAGSDHLLLAGEAFLAQPIDSRDLTRPFPEALRHPTHGVE